MRVNRFLVAVLVGAVVAPLAVLALQTPLADDQELRRADSNRSEWLMINKGYFEQRYSQLDQIDSSNVDQLVPAWDFVIGEGGGPQEATPLFADGVLYGITNWSITFAVDARTGEEIWRYDPQVDRSIDEPGADRLCCGVISRGVALYEDKVIVPVVDGHIAALDKETGRELWKILAVPPDSVSYTITMAPRVMDGKIVIGMAGAEFPPFRGYVSAYSVEDGSEIWRFYTVPGNPALGFENEALEMAAGTWTGEWWVYGGGGSVWDGMAYDPEPNLVYFGTGNGTPWSQDLRQGSMTEHLGNLYAASIVAVDADNGELRWFYQTTPADQWDYDAVLHLVLADIEIEGRERQVIMQVNKNGFFYVLDRITGEFISAEAVSLISWATGIDPETGIPTVHPDAHYTSERGVTVYPVQAHNTAQMSFSPDTGLVYVPIAPSNSFTFTAESEETFEIRPGGQNLGIIFGRGRGAAEPAPIAVPPTWGPERDIPGGRGGILSAWDPATQTERWFGLGGGQSGGGTLATAGNLVFQVVNDGRLMAYSADEGELLLEVVTGQRGGMSPPMTYELDGKQYVVLAGGTGAGGRGFGGRGNAEPTSPPAFPRPDAGNPTLMVFTLR
jgi:alcohol dehydrogenase (cytochrome c)/quinohemoprotein ethanol dehydrogenase